MNVLLTTLLVWALVSGARVWGRPTSGPDYEHYYYEDGVYSYEYELQRCGENEYRGGEDGQCHDCPPCAHGQKFSEPCGWDHGSDQVTCVNCEDNTYSDGSSTLRHHCMRCTNCTELHRDFLRPCYSHKDAVCKDTCWEGYVDPYPDRTNIETPSQCYKPHVYTTMTPAQMPSQEASGKLTTDAIVGIIALCGVICLSLIVTVSCCVKRVLGPRRELIFPVRNEQQKDIHGNKPGGGQEIPLLDRNKPSAPLPSEQPSESEHDVTDLNEPRHQHTDMDEPEPDGEQNTSVLPTEQPSESRHQNTDLEPHSELPSTANSLGLDPNIYDPNGAAADPGLLLNSVQPASSVHKTLDPASVNLHPG